MRSTWRETLGTAVFCLLAAALLLLLCSQCSPLYPINLWDDANCLLTVGRVMRAGGVLYRDIYEQKGPTLYLLHMIAAMISDSSFFGVYLLEVLSLAAAMLLSCRVLRRRVTLPASLAATALFWACALVSASFARGDSAEEFCLPYLVAALAVASDAYGRRDGAMRPSRLILCGLLCGVVATIKYTVLGLFIGLCAFEGVLALRHGGLRRALQSGAAFLLGMAIPVALWCAYFASQGALSDFFTAYIYNNIFLYDGGVGADSALIACLRLVRDNAVWLLPAAAGICAYTLLGRDREQLRFAVLAMAVCAATAAFFLGRLWPYCPLALCAFGPHAMTGLIDAAGRLARGARLTGRRARLAVCGGACALSLLLALWASPNAFLRGAKLSDLAQGRLASLIPPGATLLQYSHLDAGLYLATGTLPQGKYFVRLNVNAPEMIKALDSSVREGETDFVVVSWRELPQEFDRYELIAADTAYDDAGRLNKALYLYRRTDE